MIHDTHPNNKKKQIKKKLARLQQFFLNLVSDKRAFH